MNDEIRVYTVGYSELSQSLRKDNESYELSIDSKRSIGIILKNTIPR